MFRLCAISLVTACLCSQGVLAGQTTTTLKGTFNNSQENACIHVSKFFYLTDCFYSRMHEEGAGHAHLYVDGRQVGRLYGRLHDIASLPPGPHEINVTLNTNDHRPYGSGKGIVQRSKKIILSAVNDNDDR